MKYLTLFSIFLILFLLPLSLFAQNGRIAGEVVVEGSELPLIGANIVVVGANLGAATDAQGFFLIGNVPPGTYQVEANYIGFDMQSNSVEVKAGEVAQVTIKMKTSILESDESIEVTTDRLIQSQKAALNAQYNASNIKNVVSSDLIGSFPDEDAQSAIARIPGVFVDEDAIAIMRGLPADYTLVSINNTRIPTVNAAEDRISQIETFPIDMIQAIEVNKGQTADLDADAIAGSINFIMKDAPSKAFFNMKAYTGLTQNVTSDYPIDQFGRFGESKVSLTIGDLIMDGVLGYTVTGTYERNTFSERDERNDWNWEDDELEESYVDINGNPIETGRRYYRDAPTETEEYIGGVNAALLYKPSLGNKFTLKAYYSFFNLTDYDLELRDYYANERMEKLNDVKHEPKHITNVSLGGDHLFWGDFHVDYNLIYSGGRGGESHDFQSNFRADYEDLQGGDSNYYFDNQNFEVETFIEDEYIIMANLKKPFQFSQSTAGYWQTGFKYRMKDRFQQKLDSEVGLYDAEDLADPDDFKNWSIKLDDPFIIEWDPPKDLIFASDNSTTMDENYTANEDIFAAYLMAEFWLWDNIMILPGVRYEATKWDSKPRLIDAYKRNNPEDTQFFATPASGDYDDLFPSLQLRFKLPANLNLRLSGSKAISRPSFRLLAGFNDYNDEDLELYTGNPELQPTRATNFDIILEHYQPEIASHVSVGYFNKRLTDVMQEVEFNAGDDSTFQTSTGAVFYPVLDITQMQNVGTGFVNGIEVSIQRQLDFIGLPQFGILANWTHQLNTYLETPEGEKTQLPTQADDVVNLALSYENAGVGFSGRISYQYRSEIYRDKSESEYWEEWTDPEDILDITLRQQIWKGVRLFLNGRNLLNTDRVTKYKNTRSAEVKQMYGMNDWYVYNTSHRSARVWAGFEFVL
jgi:outer membrane receptor protein involved in Fe transport